MSTASLVAFVDKVIEILNANKEALGLHSVWYGDQQKLPGSPVVCVEPDTKSNDLKNAQRGISIELRCYILVYSATITSPQTNRRDSDVLAESIETLLHADPQLGNLVIHCMVREVASGYANKSGTLVRANRLTFTGTSQSRLPS